MSVTGLVFGILSLLFMLVGFVPCLGALNWINIPIAIIGMIISGVALSQLKSGESSGKAIAGMVMCGIAILFGIIRLVLGGGVV